MKAVGQVFVFDLAAKGLMAVAAIALIRYTPVSEYAVYTIALSLATLISQTVSSTINRIYILGHEELRASHASSAFLWLQIWGITGLSLVLLPATLGWGAVCLAAAGLSMAQCLAEYGKTGLQQEQRFLGYSLAELGRAAATAGSVLGLIALSGHSLSATAILAAQGLAVGALFLLVFHRRIAFNQFLSVRPAWRLIVGIANGEYKWLLAYFLVLAVFTQTDVMMLKWLGTDAELANFGAAFRYYSLLSLALAAVHAVLLPMIRQLRSQQELQEIFKKHFRLLLVFGPTVALFAWGSGWVLPWVDLGKYPESVGVFRVLCVSVILSFAFSPHVNLAMRAERFRFLFAMIMAALTINAVLNWLLIPAMGASGAAWSTLAASAFFNATMFQSVRRTKLALQPDEMYVRCVPPRA